MSRTSKCDRCGQDGVYWKLSNSTGKRYLYDPQKVWTDETGRERIGRAHFLDCPYARPTQKLDAEEAQKRADAEKPPTERKRKSADSGLTEEKIREIVRSMPQNGSGSADEFNRRLTVALQSGLQPRNAVREIADSQDKLLRTDLEYKLTDLRLSFDQALRFAVDSSVSAVEQNFSARIEQMDRSNREIVVVLPSGQRTEVGRQHEKFEELVEYVSAGLNVFVAGPAGSGKTEGAKACATALGLDFYVQPLNPMLSDSKLTGFMNANGAYVTTATRQAYEFGGLLLLDEGDNSNPSILAGINALLSNGEYGFPDKLVQRHENFRCILTANTWGYGADRQYVARQQLDAATLNRFVKIAWDYDEAFERVLAGHDEWVSYVQAVRKAVFTHKLRFVVSPRQSIFGALLLKHGQDRAKVEQAVLWADIPSEAQTTIRAELRKSRDAVRSYP